MSSTPASGAPAPAPTRRRGPAAWVIGAVVILGLLAGGAFALDRWAHGQTEATLVEEVTAAGGTDVTAEVAGFPFLTQYLSGSLDDVRLTAASLPVEDTTLTDLTLRAHGVRIDDAHHATAESVELEAFLPPGEIETLVRTQLATYDGAPDEIDVTLGDGVVQVAATVTMIVAIPAGVTFDVGLVDDAVTLTPVGASIAGAEIDLSALPDGLWGDLASIAIPFDGLPDGLALTGIAVTPDAVALQAAGVDVVLPGG